MSAVENVKWTKQEIFGRLVYKAQTALDNGAPDTDDYTTEALALPKGALPTILMINHTDTADGNGAGAADDNGIFLEGSFDKENWAAYKVFDWTQLAENSAKANTPAASDGDFPYIRVRVNLATAITDAGDPEITPYVVISP